HAPEHVRTRLAHRLTNSPSIGGSWSPFARNRYVPAATALPSLSRPSQATVYGPGAVAQAMSLRTTLSPLRISTVPWRRAKDDMRVGTLLVSATMKRTQPTVSETLEAAKGLGPLPPAASEWPRSTCTTLLRPSSIITGIGTTSYPRATNSSVCGPTGTPYN